MSKKIISNLIQQNCYVRDVVRAFDLNTPQSSYEYESLVEKVLPDGTSFSVEKFSYPITPEYVKSFQDVSDYRNDPLGCARVSGSNLGDIRSYQDIMSMDSESAQKLYSQLKERFSEPAKAELAKVEPAKTEITNDDGGKNV